MGKFVDSYLLKGSAILAEENGFEVFLVWDHYLQPESNTTLEAYEALAYVSSVTSKMKIGTVVTPIPFRNVIVLGKMTSFLDFLCNHRFILGVGMGWHKPEFDLFSKWEPAKIRFEKTRKGIDLLKEIWRGGGDTIRQKILPKPKTSYIPMWFGTTGTRMMKLAAEVGDGWIPVFISANEYEEKARLLTNFLRESKRQGNKIKYKKGHDDGHFTFAVYVVDRRLQKRSPSYLIRTVESYQNAGAKLFSLAWSFNPLDKKNYLKRIEWFRKEVMNSF
jgi:alkanesulfonate monooxygenase SsuD/methylene tetrahydromethanopterin reductase-like flavin-dependent oxidoreductase (luciferase family)